MKLFKDFGIRAWFGTIIIFSFIGLFAIALFKVPHYLGVVKDAFVPIVMAVIAFYFGQRSQEHRQ